jgi:hypothetical protein
MQVLIIMSEDGSDAAIDRLRRALRGGRAGPVEVPNRAREATEFFRRFLFR